MHNQNGERKRGRHSESGGPLRSPLTKLEVKKGFKDAGGRSRSELSVFYLFACTPTSSPRPIHTPHTGACDSLAIPASANQSSSPEGQYRM
ncbi:hypothetical protein Q8A67_022356 [Cirrhinus molitorella]|uniref:Uncharacterized protein n=1 Tax=Cirrhinus molitorella TaxID=172907 RepID=A0AA88P9D0_9TELE|nr:hypothetical protein Q8A67_022356 [Cirrhinus molitorella]